MKVLKYLSMALVARGFASCEKHEIQFKNEPLAADRAMMEAGIRRENRKDYVDQIAAAFILQGYLVTLKKGE